MTGQWLLTNTHHGTVTHHPCATLHEAKQRATTLPGINEINYHYTIGPHMSTQSDKEAERTRLFDEAVQAHQDYLDGIEQLKYQRQLAFKRAVAGRVSRAELADAIDKAPRTISHIIHGR